ncbi:hypothetical protein SCHPADRAFT_725685 [Schizopora paradoxa]|uniref:DUF6533 domain-containing protein n=1 Tax=Schizopora paradoxa TaxID=27342 RepID=A0A0H2R7N6_9AGAM|nr:hypothetical protein SCHPADRAFT_725685 [Schizopora paradoxa]
MRANDGVDISGDLAQALNVKYILVSVITLFVYDVVIFIPDETRCIWQQRWSFGKAFYILARYGCFIDVAAILWYSFTTSHSLATCHTAYDFITWAAFCGTVICHLVLILRTYAIWNRNIFVLAYLFLLVFTAVVISIFELNESNESIIFLPSTSIVPCASTLTNNKMFLLYCFVSAVELNVVVLSLIKGISHWRKNSSILVHTLFRDGVLYFAVLFSISITNVIFMLKMPKSPYYDAIAVPQRVLHSVLASRVILNWLDNDASHALSRGAGRK